LSCLLLLVLFSQDLSLADVGGTHLVGAVTAHGKTYLMYRGQGRFDLFTYDWDTGNTRLVPKDGRVKTLLFAYLIPTETGVAIASVGAQNITLLSKDGAFEKHLDMRPLLEDGEEATYACPGEGTTFFLTTRLDGHCFYSRVDWATRQRETLYRVDAEGGHYLLPYKGNHLVIRYRTGDVTVLDGSFQVKTQYGSLIEPANRVAAVMKGESQFVIDPIVAGGHVSLQVTFKKGKDRIDAAARFEEGRLLYAAYRTLALSPDGTRKMLLDCELDELKVVPLDFTFPEVRFPPAPGGVWPPKP